MEPRNESETLFEQYLDLNGFSGKWVHEPSIPGKSKKLDYLLNYKSRKYFFEVKELRKKGNSNRYKGLRGKINEARKQFKQFKDYSCSLVMFNVDDRQARLDPLTVLSAMLGNFGFMLDIDGEGKPVIGTEKNAFLDGGRMVDDKGRLQNTTISDIIILANFLDNVEIEKAFREVERNQGRRFTAEEALRNRMELQKKYSVSSVPRVIVVGNPYARIAFSEGLFVGPFDEHWRWTEEDGKIERVFAGDKLKELEEIKSKS